MDEIKGIRIVSLTGEKEYGIEDSEVREELANVVDGAPEELDSFKEAFEKFKEGGEALAGIADDVAAVGKAVTDETARAQAAEEELEKKIADEAVRATAALAAEKTRAEQVEAGLDKKIAVEIDKIKDGDTIVGQAREIHSRNGKTVTDSFLARTTAGSGTIGDGVASLKSVGGNIVKNLVGDLTDKNAGRINLKEIDGYYFLTTKKADAAGSSTLKLAVNPTVVGHKYYFGMQAKSSKLVSAFLKRYDVNDYLVIRQNVTEYAYLSNIVTETVSRESLLLYMWGYNGTVEVGEQAAFSQPLLVDLTEMYGAGNEPDKATCDKMFSTMDALPQGLTVAKPTAFTSTGFNQFNPENVLEGKAIVDNAIESGDKMIAVIECLPCKVGIGENNGYCIHGDFGDDINVYLTPLNPKDVNGELYMHKLEKDATTDTYVPLIKGYLLVEVPTTVNLCAHFLWSEDKCKRDSYEPYFESRIELPAIPEMSEWGLAGIQTDGTLVCDEIDLERMVYTKRIGRLKEMDKLVWYKGTDGLFYSQQITTLRNYSNTIITDARYTKGAYADGTITINGRSLYIWDTTIESSDELKNLLKDKTLYYHLKTDETYPIVTKVDNNYISSDYGVEQFDSVVPCNANNLYYMRSLAGETRNFLDRLMAGLGTADATVVADRILAVVNPAVEPANVEPETPVEE